LDDKQKRYRIYATKKSSGNFIEEMAKNQNLNCRK
jgi:hypothetical protein